MYEKLQLSERSCSKCNTWWMNEPAPLATADKTPPMQMERALERLCLQCQIARNYHCNKFQIPFTNKNILSNTHKTE